MTMAVLIITICVLLFAIAAIVFFRLKAPTAGAVFAILALFFTLADVKAFQFRKMASSPMTMPLTTVTSAPVKEEDWPPILSSIGSLSAVQGAVVAAELAGVVSKVAFENGSTAKQGDMLVQLDTSAEEAQLRTAEADVELARADLHTDAAPGQEFKGTLTAINSMVDAVTRNITVQATVQNPDHVLRPGMFGKVEVELPEKHKTLVIPGSAISYAPFGDSVFVIEKKKDEKTGKETETIRQQFVRLGEARGDLVAITDGLKPNELVVSTGVFKLRNGMAVTINNDLAPKPQVNPTPVDS